MSKTQESAGALCGPSNPAVGSRVPMSRLLHDNGFGYCLLYRGDHFIAAFTAMTLPRWDPQTFPPRTLSWVERKVRTWDDVPSGKPWSVELAWPWQSETWVRQRPGYWVVTESSTQGIA